MLAKERRVYGFCRKTQSESFKNSTFGLTDFNRPKAPIPLAFAVKVTVGFQDLDFGFTGFSRSKPFISLALRGVEVDRGLHVKERRVHGFCRTIQRGLPRPGRLRDKLVLAVLTPPSL